MKRTIIFCLSLIMGIATMMAQDATKCDQQNKGQRPMLSPEQKAQLITDRMVKAYDLNDDQKTKLFDLNLKALSRLILNLGSAVCSNALNADFAGILGFVNLRRSDNLAVACL